MFNPRTLNAHLATINKNGLFYHSSHAVELFWYLCHSCHVSQLNKSSTMQCFGQHVCHHLFSWTVVGLQVPITELFSYEVIFDGYIYFVWPWKCGFLAMEMADLFSKIVIASVGAFPKSLIRCALWGTWKGQFSTVYSSLSKARQDIAGGPVSWRIRNNAL